MKPFLVAAWAAGVLAWLAPGPGTRAEAQSAWPPAGQAIRVPVTRDTWVSSYPGEQDGNNGGASQLKTKGIDEMTILDFDPAPLAGRVITGATLHLRTRGAQGQRRVSVSTLAGDWNQGTGVRYQPQTGSACFTWARKDRQPWAYPGSDLTAACNGMGHTLWRFAEAGAPDGEGWQTVAVEPAVIAARVAGLSYGLVLTDDVGSEYQHNGDTFIYKVFPNRFLYSTRAGSASAPYLTVYVGPADTDPPPAPPGLAQVTTGPTLPAGEALVCWQMPRDVGPAGTIGFLVRLAEGPNFDWARATAVPRYRIPMAPRDGQGGVELYLRDMGLRPGSTYILGVRAVDGAGNVGPAATCPVLVSQGVTAEILPAPVAPFADAGGALPRIGGAEVAVIDLLDKVDPVTGALIPRNPGHAEGYLRANHLWSASRKLVRLFAARNEFTAFQVRLAGATAGVGLEVQFAGDDGRSIRTELLRFRHVACGGAGASGGAMLPDPLLPLPPGGTLTIPAADEAIAGQTCATAVVDVYVGHEAAAGVHRGTLRLTGGGETLTIDVELNVWDFTLPDYLSFIPEMNCYGLPGAPADLAYYRLAHAHRTCLNRLGYNWRGEVSGGCGPRWDPRTRRFAWDDYDRHFGPILDGSAFADLPRRGVPVDTFYLPLNENFPMDLARSFRGGYWADEAFTPAYRALLVEAARQFTEHFRQKGWNDTLAEFFLNGKVSFKDHHGWSYCSAPWTFDEPVATQDFWALRWYGTAFHEGVGKAWAEAQLPAGAGPKMVFRCDVSRPQWQRDLLDGVLDVDVVGGAVRQYGRMVAERQAAGGGVTITYGGSNAIEQANTQPALWCLESWCVGLDGVLPWQTIGSEGAWQKGDSESLFYPGAAVGLAGPVPSVRLKAYRQGEQDVEYLVLLSRALGVPRWAVGRAALEALGLHGRFGQRGGQDAGAVDYDATDPQAIWALRVRVGAMLTLARPGAQRRLVDLRPPRRDGAELPDLGYVTVGPPR